MHFSFLLPVATAISFASIANAAQSDDLLAYIKAHPGTKGIGSTDADYLDWKANAFTTNSTPAAVVPKAYIIQLKPGTDLLKRGEHMHDHFHKRAAEQIDYTTRQEFKDPGLFYGLSIQVKDNANETTIAELPEVLKVWPVRSIPHPVREIKSFPNAKSGAAPQAAPLASLVPKAGPGAHVNSVHRQTEVDRLHELGIKGKGIKIAVIDTGVDYHHKSLGGGFGPGFKVSFGKDFAGDNQTGVPTTDDDPLATCVGGGHGTHVSGIIGAVDPPDAPWGLVGVAPEADLGMYRVFGCSGSAPDDLVILAFQQAAIDKVDIVSASLGNYALWEEADPFQIITAGLEARGIAVIVANGNSALIPGQTNSPGIGRGVIAVGSAQNSHFPIVYGAKDSRGRSLKYSGDPRPVDAPATGLTVYDFVKIAANTSSPLGCAFDAWWAADDAVPDKENSIIAVPYGDWCSWGTKIDAAQGLGFKYVVVYAVEDGDIFSKEYNALSPLPSYFGITLNVVDGKTLLGGLAASKPGEYKLFFNDSVFESSPQLTAGAISNFSSWGPAGDTLAIKPQVSAPGGSILSTWPLAVGGYAILSGTSMATPYVAGAFALLKSQFPTATVRQLREKLQSTSKGIQYVYDNTIRTSIAQQGGGMINVYNAIHFESHVSPSELNLGDTDALKPREVTIENQSSRTKTYIISHEPAGEANLFPFRYSSKSEIGKNAFPGQFKSYAGVSFSQTSITIPANGKASFTATFTPPTDFADVYLPFYSGFIKITNNNDEFRVAYLGVPYSRYKAEYLDIGDDFTRPWLYRYNPDSSRERVTDIQSFDFGVNPNGTDFPYLEWVVQQSSQYWRIDVVPYNTSFVPTHYGFNHTASNPQGVPDSALPLVYPNLKINSTEAGVETYGLWADLIRDSRPSAYLFFLPGEISNYNQVPLSDLPKGDYRALLRALKWGGDPDKEDGYQSWLSPVIRVEKTILRNSTRLR